MPVIIESFFDDSTYTFSYILYNDSNKEAIIIDPVLDYDQESSRISTESMQKLQAFISENKLEPILVIETHAHADHLTSSNELKKIYPKIKTAISEDIVKVQTSFKEILELKEQETTGNSFDILLTEGKFTLGSFNLEIIKTPGHTPACISILCEDKLFTGDAIFLPDTGTGRCDFPGGSAAELYQSITKLYKLDPETVIYVGHDYGKPDREIQNKTTISAQMRSNIMLNASTTREDFIQKREERDKSLKEPKLIYPSIEVNISNGKNIEPSKPILYTLPRSKDA